MSKTPPPPIKAQREAIERIIKSAGPLDPELAGDAAAAVVTLKWFEANRNFVRALWRLVKTEPQLAAIFNVFPDAMITNVRDIEPNANPDQAHQGMADARGRREGGPQHDMGEPVSRGSALSGSSTRGGSYRR